MKTDIGIITYGWFMLLLSGFAFIILSPVLIIGYGLEKLLTLIRK